MDNAKTQKGWRPEVNRFQDNAAKEQAIGNAQIEAALAMPEYLRAAMLHFNGARRFLALPVFGSNLPIYVMAESITAIMPVETESGQKCEIIFSGDFSRLIDMTAGEVYGMITGAKKDTLQIPAQSA